MRACKKCGLLKDEQTDFYTHSKGGVLRKECKKCTNKERHQRYLRNNERAKKRARTYYRTNLSKVRATAKAYLKTPKGRLVKLMRAAQSRAKKYGHTYDLNSAFLLEMWNNQNARCALTGFPFEFDNKTKYEANPFAPSIDRIDSSRGYEKDNVRLICVAMNYALNEFGEEIFRQICEAYLSSSKK